MIKPMGRTALVFAVCVTHVLSSRDGSHNSHGLTLHKKSHNRRREAGEVQPLNQTLMHENEATSVAKPEEVHGNHIASPENILFYSFFVSMEKSAGYALPFANKLCYMESYGYRWMLDVVPSNKVPKRPGSSGSLHMAPTWYKPGGIAKWLERVDYLVYLDMDLVVKKPSVDFAAQYVGTTVKTKGGTAVVADLTVTDHNKALNNGAFVLRGSAWGKKFVSRWVKISDSKFAFPFTDNGSFIETILSFIPAYGASNHACMKVGIKAKEYLSCAAKYLDKALGPFTGDKDRVLEAAGGGIVRFVAPKNGFNSHEWNHLRPGQGWRREACYQPGWFVLHTKNWVAEVPKGSERCDATAKAQLTTAPGEHLYGDWGSCSAGSKSAAGQACAARLPKKSGARVNAAVSGTASPLNGSATAVTVKKNKMEGGGESEGGGGGEAGWFGEDNKLSSASSLMVTTLTAASQAANATADETEKAAARARVEADVLMAKAAAAKAEAEAAAGAKFNETKTTTKTTTTTTTTTTTMGTFSNGTTAALVESGRDNSSSSSSSAAPSSLGEGMGEGVLESAVASDAALGAADAAVDAYAVSTKAHVVASRASARAAALQLEAKVARSQAELKNTQMVEELAKKQTTRGGLPSVRTLDGGGEEGEVTNKEQGEQHELGAETVVEIDGEEQGSDGLLSPPQDHHKHKHHKSIGLDKVTGKKLHAEFLKKASGGGGGSVTGENTKKQQHLHNRPSSSMASVDPLNAAAYSPLHLPPLPPPDTPPPPLLPSFLQEGVLATESSGSALGFGSNVNVSTLSAISTSTTITETSFPPEKKSSKEHTSSSSSSSTSSSTTSRSFLYPKVFSLSDFTPPDDNTNKVCTALPPLSSVQLMTSKDRFAAVAAPKTATTSLTELMSQAGLEACCGGVLWQMGNPPGACPKSHQTSVKLMPFDWEATERGGRPKHLSHLLHNDYVEAVKAWRAHDGKHSEAAEDASAAEGVVTNKHHHHSSSQSPPLVPLPHLKMVVVLRDPLTRLYSAYVHGKNFKMRNQMSPKDTKAMRSGESFKQRMDRFRRFYWSYRDYNDTALAATDRVESFEAFASLEGLPTQNQQTRMLAGVGPKTAVTPSLLSLAKTHLCRVECVGVLENLPPLVKCMNKQLGPRKQMGKGGGGKAGGPLELPKKNVKAGQKDNRAATTTTTTGGSGKRRERRRRLGADSAAPSASSGPITEKAREAVARHSWADFQLHAFAKGLVETRAN